jgi:hypothetical protein
MGTVRFRWMNQPAHHCTRAVLLSGRHKGRHHAIRPGQQVIEIEGETLDLSDQSGEQVAELFRYEFDSVTADDPGLAGFVARPEEPSFVRVR